MGDGGTTVHWSDLVVRLGFIKVVLSGILENTRSSVFPALCVAISGFCTQRADASAQSARRVPGLAYWLCPGCNDQWSALKSPKVILFGPSVVGSDGKGISQSSGVE